LRAASEDIGLINRVIKFHLPQCMWSLLTNVTDGQTDGQTDVKRSHDRYIAKACSGKNAPPRTGTRLTQSAVCTAAVQLNCAAGQLHHPKWRSLLS